ncbi:hypothetical protein AZE42_01601 [Rhizopogon vesiculosus]|uniref:CCHC-type domain-containing protein n=1 Tax=Rhizopogon vesiculosus TaxID=180088 RepID=A0A1J8R4H8_9AGAM|nr:hypothetical protein AZE42_01601 [Rhizopogon vesiculosus]
MTRVTNFGRKRTYVEAGFTNDALAEESAEPQASTSALPSESDQAHPKTKRKRTKKPKESDGNDGESARSTEGKAQDAVGSEQAKVAPKKKPKGQRKTKVRPDPAQRSETRRQKRIAERHADTTCFACRLKGHPAKDCPTTRNKAIGGDGSNRQSRVGICYRCAQSGTATFIGMGQGAGADEDDFHTLKRKNVEVDRDIKKDERAKKRTSVQAELYTRTVKAFGTSVGNSQKTKKVVHF